MTGGRARGRRPLAASLAAHFVAYSGILLLVSPAAGWSEPRLRLAH